MEYGASPYYTSSNQGVTDLDLQSRGSSSSALLLSPNVSDWPTQQLYTYDGRTQASKPSSLTALGANEGRLGHGIPGEPQHYQASESGAQMTSPGGGITYPFVNASTSHFQHYVPTVGSTSYNLPVDSDNAGLYGAFGTQTIFPHQMDQKMASFDTQSNSASPMNEIRDSPSRPSSSLSPEIQMVSPQPRRASEGSSRRPRRGSSRRMSDLMTVEESVSREKATRGLGKDEKRRVQNKLAQRAFRARNKIDSQNFQTHVDDMEKLTELQAAKIHQMSETISHLQRENEALRAQSDEAISNRPPYPPP